jgi:hypothetical protein
MRYYTRLGTPISVGRMLDTVGELRITEHNAVDDLEFGAKRLS